ncbi:hypothetical protein HDZ31DRAFT_65289 [Schizophyllum fasciatum]
MVLDTHGYLASQGWSGHGNGLRHGSISRPVIIAQKKNNKGLGKERDDGFQFWNHVFDAAVKTINIKIADSDDESGAQSNSAAPVLPALNRTSTGILSNRAPILGGSAISSETSSGTSTPTVKTATMSIFAQAKRETARRSLYGRFYRAFVIQSDDSPSPSEYQPGRFTEEPLAAIPIASTSTSPAPTPQSDTPKTNKKKAEKKMKVEKVAQPLDADEERRRRKAEKKEAKRRREKGKGREDSDGGEGEIRANASDERKEKKARKRKERPDSDEAKTGQQSDVIDTPTSAEPPKKMRKKDARDAVPDESEDKMGRKERKRLKRETKAAAAASGEAKKKRKKTDKHSSG